MTTVVPRDRILFGSDNPTLLPRSATSSSRTSTTRPSRPNNPPQSTVATLWPAGSCEAIAVPVRRGITPLNTPPYVLDASWRLGRPACSTSLRRASRLGRQTAGGAWLVWYGATMRCDGSPTSLPRSHAGIGHRQAVSACPRFVADVLGQRRLVCSARAHDPWPAGMSRVKPLGPAAARGQWRPSDDRRGDWLQPSLGATLERLPSATSGEPASATVP
jgi:hypothetical protein